MGDSRNERTISRSDLSQAPPDGIDDAALFKVLTPLVSACLAANHDINNWLSGIFGYTEFLQTEADSLNDEQRKYLDKIMQCAERIQHQINRMSAVKSDLAADVDMEFLNARLRGELE